MKKKYNALILLWIMLMTYLSACERDGVLRKVSTSKAGVAYGVHVDDGYAYITNNDGVIIFDVQEPSHPREIARIPKGYTPSILIQNDMAYIASESGLTIANVRYPANPELMGEYEGEGCAHRVQIDGSVAYIASSEGLEIVDISNPNMLLQIAHLRGGDAWGVDVYEDIVYLAVPGNGLEVIDVGDPSAPKKIGTIAGTQRAWDVHVHQQRAYVGCHAKGIVILSLANKESPQILGRYLDEDGGEALGVWGDDETLYVADNFGIEALDVKDPTHPKEVGEYDSVNGAHDITVDGTFLYIAEGKKGLIILEFMGGNQ